MLDDCRNTASPRAESCDWLVLSDWSHWLDRISRPFQALDVARRVQVTWLAISSTPLAVNSVVLDFQSSKIKSHVYKVLLNSIYDASKDLWPSICTWSTTWQRKKKQTEALGVNSATALFKRGARTDPEILERGVLACYIDTIILFAGDLFYSLVTELWDHLYICVHKIELKKTDSAENSFNRVAVKKEKKAPPPLKPLALLLLYQIWIQSTLP